MTGGRETFWACVAVAAGAGLGGLGRAAVSAAAASVAGPGFPWGTLAVNVLGSFAVGFFASLTAADGRVSASAPLRHFVTTGFCGGFTTFSVFSLEAVALATGDGAAAAGVLVAVSVAGWLAAVWAGHVLGAWMNGVRRD